MLDDFTYSYVNIKTNSFHTEITEYDIYNPQYVVKIYVSFRENVADHDLSYASTSSISNKVQSF